MTEAEWLACADPETLLDFLRDRTTERKFRLFAVSAIWQLMMSFGDNETKKVVEVVSQAAEGAFNRSELRDEREKIGTWSYPSVPASLTSDYVTRAAGLGLETDPLRAVLMMVSAVTHLEAELLTKKPSDPASRDLVRLQCSCRLISQINDIFGNPFRSTGIKRDWRTSTVLALTQGIHTDRVFDRLAILADALQDAGCENEDILNHCRSESVHVRGCWVIDLILGKE
jgi:hypothetical protein